MGVRSTNVTQASAVDEVIANRTQEGVLETVRITVSALGQQIAAGSGAIVAKQIKSTFAQLDAIKGTMAEGDIGIVQFDPNEALRGQYALESGVLVKKADLVETLAETYRDEAQAARDEAVAVAPSTWQDLRDETVEARDLAEDWAEKAEDSPVEPGKFSALHHALKAEVQADRATEEADRAETASDAAQLSSGTFDDTTLGLAGTSSGDYFSVPSASDDGYLDLYKNTAGSAVLVNTYPSLAGIGTTISRRGLPDGFRAMALAVFLDADGNEFGRVNLDGTWDINVIGSVTNSETVIARGDAATLDDRLSAAMTSLGTTLEPRFGLERLRNAHLKLTRLAAGESGQFNLVPLGDSYTQNASRWVGTATALLVAAYGDGGGGWTGYGYFSAYSGPYAYAGAQPSGVNGNARSTYGLKYKGSWTSVYNASPSPDLCLATSSAAGDGIERTVPASPDHTALRVIFLGTADGVIRHRVDGGAWSGNVNVQGVDQIDSFDIALTAGAHTVEIEVVSGTVKLCGDNALSAANGVRVHKLGGSGSRLAQWVAQDETEQVAAWTLLAADAFIIMDGTNSQGAAVAPATWAGQLETLVERQRSAAAIPDILVAMPMENLRVGNAYPMGDYALLAREFAAANDAAFIDLQSFFGDPADYASDGPRPLFNADDIHPEPATGGRVIAGAILGAIKPF